MPKAKAGKSKYIFLLLRIAVVVCGVIWGAFWLRREVGWDNLAKTFLRIDFKVFAVTLGFFIIGQIIIALRWWLLLRSQAIFIDFWATVRLYFLGWFYNNFMPGSVGGDLVRAWYVTKHTDKRLEAVLSVFVDRLIGLSSTFIIAVFFYLLFLQGKGLVITSSGQGGILASIAEQKWVLTWILGVVAVIFCVLLLHRTSRAIIQKGWLYICSSGFKIIKKLRDAIIIYCRKPLTILAAFGLTIFLQMLTITGFWLLGVNLGMEVSIKYYYVFFTLTWVLGAVPISIAGAAVVEGSLAYLFIRFAGAGKDAVSVLALCQRIVWMLASLPGAVIHLIGAHLPKDFFVDYDENIN